MYTHVKTILLSTLMMFSLMIGSSLALAVAIDRLTNLPPDTEINIPELNISGTTNEHGELHVKASCIEGESYDIFDGDGKPLTPFVCNPVIGTLTYSAVAVGTVAVIVGIAANSGGGNGAAAAPAGANVDPGPFTSCTLQIPNNGSLVASGGPTSFSTSPVTLFGNPGHIFRVNLLAGTGFGGGVEIVGSVAGNCLDTCAAGGTIFPLTLNCGNAPGCGFASFSVTDCTAAP